jgi:hypothetical protein
MSSLGAQSMVVLPGPGIFDSGLLLNTANNCDRDHVNNVHMSLNVLNSPSYCLGALGASPFSCLFWVKPTRIGFACS